MSKAPATPAPRSLAGLISPRSVAVIGASSDATRIGGRPIDYMVRRKFQGVDAAFDHIETAYGMGYRWKE